VTGQHIHLIAICGTGMASLAGMLKARGHRVTGSDLNVYPPMSTFLVEQNIEVYQGFDASHLQPHPDLVIVGNAMSRGNPEVEYTLNHRLPYKSLPEALKEFFIRDKYSCVVAGTHGKTTTSSLLSWTLASAGRDPSFFIGGVPENFGRGFGLGNGPHMVLEGDEYDSAFFDKGPKFLHYLPSLVILNNVEFDHADIYRSFEDVKIAFRRLINIIPQNGHLIACADDNTVAEMLPRAFCSVETFGLSVGSAWQPENLVQRENGCEFFLAHKQERFGPFFLPLFGEHNVKNATAVFVAAIILGLQPAEIDAAFRAFKGVCRRMQVRHDADGVLVLDDFAHHPTEVRETLRAAKARYPNRRLWAVFEPRTATTKRKVFQNEYLTAFAAADRVVFSPMHRPDKVPADELMSLEEVRDGIAESSIPVDIVPAGEEMADFIFRQLQKGDVVLFMSNGDFSGMPARLIEKLKKNQTINLS
jgi:UDP-N-acetylmuramate: L-alanyl-gamma-D-glutamyl-meso-diaminopimelate ligase